MDLPALHLPDASGALESVKASLAANGVSFWGAVAVVLLAGYAVARGVLSQLMRMLSMISAVLVAMYVFRNRADMFGSIAANMSTDTLLMVSAAAGLLTFFLARGLINIVVGFGLVSFLASMTGWKAGLISLIPSSVLVWLSAMVVRLVGSVYGVENAAVEKGATGSKSDLGAWVEQLAQMIDHSSIGALTEQLDPYDLRVTSNLARLLILWPDNGVWEKIAARSPESEAALNHPEIVALGRDEKVRQAIDRQNFAGLLQLPQVVKAARNPQLRPFLKDLVLEGSMDGKGHNGH